MANVQLVEIRVKLANETISPPDNATPSSAPELIAFDQFILDNGTRQFPFVWSIINATTAAGSVHILRIQVNNETYQISNWSANDGYNFRLILELWVWQTNLNMLTFGWNSNGAYHTVASSLVQHDDPRSSSTASLIRAASIGFRRSERNERPRDTGRHDAFMEGYLGFTADRG